MAIGLPTKPLVFRPTHALDMLWGHPLAQGLVGGWMFQEGAGRRVANIIPDALPGTFVANDSVTYPTWTLFHRPQYGGRAIQNQTQSYISVGDYTLLNPPRITVHAWFYRTSTTAGEPGVTKRHLGNNSNNFFLGTGSNPAVGMFSFIAYTSAGTLTAESSTNFTTNAWHQVVGTYDGSNARLWVDRVNTATTVGSGTLNGNTFPKLVLGSDFQVNGYWNGRMAFVVIWNRALASAEITELYTNPHAFLAPPSTRRYFMTGLLQTPVSRDDVMPWEALRTLASDRVIPFEGLSPAIADRVLPWETLGALAADRVLPFESVSPAQLDHLSPWEALGTLLGDHQIPWEATSPAVFEDGIVPWETLGSALGDRSAPWEALGFRTADHVEPWESVGIWFVDHVTPFEALGVAAIDWLAFWEVLGATAADHLILFEALGLGTMDRIALWESLGTGVSDRVLLWETVGSLGWDRVVLWDALGPTAANRIIPHEALAALAQNAQLPWEALAVVFGDRILFVEALAVVVGNRIIPFNADGSVLGDREIPWEARGVNILIHLSDVAMAGGAFASEAMQGPALANETIKDPAPDSEGLA